MQLIKHTSLQQSQLLNVWVCTLKVLNYSENVSMLLKMIALYAKNNPFVQMVADDTIHNNQPISNAHLLLVDFSVQNWPFWVGITVWWRRTAFTSKQYQQIPISTRNLNKNQTDCWPFEEQAETVTYGMGIWGLTAIVAIFTSNDSLGCELQALATFLPLVPFETTSTNLFFENSG